MGDLYSLQPARIVFYGVSWCGDCRRARRVFSEQSVPYVDVDIDQDTKAADFVIKLNRGNRSVPTIIFPNGTKLTEPSTATLTENLAKYKQTA
jgi:mycoredoxin